MKATSALLELASKYPHSITDIQFLFEQCFFLYGNKKSAIDKTEIVLIDSLQLNLSLDESFWLQRYIDFYVF